MWDKLWENRENVREEDEAMKEKKKSSWKKKTAVGMVAAAASASVLVGGAFDSPADLLDVANGDDDGSPTPIVETLAAQVPDVITDDGDDNSDEERRQRFPAVRRFVQSLPVTVRALLGVPLWCIGWGLTEALGLLWQAAMTPLGGKILSWLLAAAAAILVYALTAKALFPNASWKKILRPRNLLLVFGGMAVLGVADTLLGVFWKDYPPISRLLRLLGGALMLTGAWLASRKLLRRHAKAERKPEEPEQKPLTVEQQAMALADSVCPPSVPRP